MPVTQTQNPGDPTFSQLHVMSGQAYPRLVVAFFPVPTIPALAPGFISLYLECCGNFLMVSAPSSLSPR